MNLARVLIEVEDRNDHVPLFTSATYSGTVYESAAVGSAVVRVTAVDKDKGRNAQLHYSIDSGGGSDSSLLLDDSVFPVYEIMTF